MRASIITGCLMTAFVVAVSLPLTRASAADLDGDEYAEPQYDEQMSDQDYGEERDQQPGRYGEAPPLDRYQDRYDEDRYDDEADDSRRGSIKDGYPVPMPPPRASAPPPRYVDRPPPRADQYACLERWQIKRRLRGEGWTALRPLGGDGRIVHILARRFDSSSDFRLRIDRCSGAVIAARPEVRQYAYRDWRWQRGW